MLLEGLLEQAGVGLQGGGEGSFYRHEEQHEVQAVQALQALVVLHREALEVAAQRQHVLLQRQLAHRLVLGGNQLLVGGQADLGVDHHLLVARQLDQHVRLETLAVAGTQADLGVVFAALLQPGVLEDPLEHQLAPVALGLLPLERAAEAGRLVAQALIELLQAFQFLGQGKALARLLLITLLDALLEGLDALAQRIEQLAEALLAGLGEALLALVEDLPGQLGELRAQFVAGILQVAQALLVAVLLLAQLGEQRGALGIQAAQLALLLLALQRPGLRGLAASAPVDLQQLALAAQRGQFGLLGGLLLAQLGDLAPVVVELRAEAVLGQLRMAQALFQQRRLGTLARQQAVQVPGQAERRQCREGQAKQEVGQIDRHKRLRAGLRGSITSAGRLSPGREAPVPGGPAGRHPGRPGAAVRGRCGGRGHYRIRGRAAVPADAAPAPRPRAPDA
ncbi:hypothetical protein FQZ97_506260 [compost metagenome]